MKKITSIKSNTNKLYKTLIYKLKSFRLAGRTTGCGVYELHSDSTRAEEQLDRHGSLEASNATATYKRLRGNTTLRGLRFRCNQLTTIRDAISTCAQKPT